MYKLFHLRIPRKHVSSDTCKTKLVIDIKIENGNEECIKVSTHIFHFPKFAKGIRQREAKMQPELGKADFPYY